jgi:hypothetical protein
MLGSLESSDAMVTVSKGGEEEGKDASPLLESTAELPIGELCVGSGGLDAKSSEFCNRVANDVPSRILAALACIRFRLIVSGDSSNSSSISECLDVS